METEHRNQLRRQWLRYHAYVGVYNRLSLLAVFLACLVLVGHVIRDIAIVFLLLDVTVVVYYHALLTRASCPLCRTKLLPPLFLAFPKIQKCPSCNYPAIYLM